MGWLSGWAKRTKITGDATKVDAALSDDLPVPVKLGTAVGQDADDMTRVFDELGGYGSDLTFGKTHYANNGYGSPANMADDNLGTYCQQMTYVAVSGINAIVSRIRLAVHNSSALAQLQSDEPVLEGSNNSTDGSDGDWFQITQITSGDCSAPGSYPGYAVDKEFVNNRRFGWYRLSGITNTTSNVYNEWEMFADDRFKLAITLSDGTTECFVEEEWWDQISETAVLWVSIPSVSDSVDTDFYLYYDSTQDDNVEERGHLCIHSDDTDGSTTFTDSSLSGHSITANGDVHHETDQAKFGASSIHFDGTSDSLSVADSPDFDLGGGPFTIDFWMQTTIATRCCIINTGNANNTNEFQIELNRTSGELSVYSGGQKCITSGSGVTDGSWHHVALVHDGTDLKYYVDGVVVGTEAGYTPAWAPTAFYIGSTYAGTEYFNGYLDEIRIEKGRAAWTANFTPPTAPYSGGHVGITGDSPAQSVWDDDFTHVFHHARIDSLVDSTSNENHGDPTNMASADLVDSAIAKGYQYDTDEFIDNVGETNFSLNVGTVQFIMKQTYQGGTNQGIWQVYDSNANRLAVWYWGDIDGTLRFTWADTPGFAATTLPGMSDFEHWAITYDFAADLYEWFHNGSSDATSTASLTAPTATGMELGRYTYSATQNYLYAHLDEFRISKKVRSDAWIKASYYACIDDFLTFGSEETPSTGITSILTLSLSIIDAATGTSRLLVPLGTGGILDLITTLEVYGVQGLRNKLSDDLLQVLRGAFGDQSILNVLAGMGLEGKQNLRLQVGTFAAGAHALRTLISGDPAAAAQILRNVIDENNRIIGTQNLLNALKDLAAQFPATSCAISIDGKPVRHRILSATVDSSQDGVHNAITIVSSDFDLYPLCDPGTLYGEQRIELQIGTRVLYFLIEERSGDDRQFSVWGRSLSAREDTPHAAETGFTLDIAQKASDVAEGLLSVSVLDWEAPDWVLPPDFEFHGAPIEGVRQIANAIGAVARSQDDGSITVRRRYPTRPVDLATASPDVSYSSETDVIEVGFRRIPGAGHSAVQVNGYSPEVFLPDLEVEEASPIQGEDVHVRAYWAGQIPVTPPTTYVTAGSATKLSEGTGTQTERVVFSGGVGELSYPPESVTSVSWIGTNGGTVSWEKHVKTIAISATEPRLASVTYTTRFTRYRLHGHDVPELVFTMVISPGRDASVRVKMGAGDREALAINEPLLTDNAICVERGRAFLDDSRYDAIEIDILAPYDDAAVDGAVVFLDEAGLSLSGNALIVSAGIEIQGPRTLNQLRVRKWAVS